MNAFQCLERYESRESWTKAVLVWHGLAWIFLLLILNTVVDLAANQSNQLLLRLQANAGNYTLQASLVVCRVLLLQVYLETQPRPPHILEIRYLIVFFGII